MAITSAICNSFKVEILTGTHNFTASTGDTFNLALYTSSQLSLDKDTTVYTSTNEITNTSGSAYSAKGQRTYKCNTCFRTDTAVCDFANISWTSASFTANGCLIFNDSAAGDPGVCVVAFGGDKTVTSGTFTIEFPAADASNAIVRIA
jgi:hypothetical protein